MFRWYFKLWNCESWLLIQMLHINMH